MRAGTPIMFVAAVMLVAGLGAAGRLAVAQTAPIDSAALYQAKCATCHGAALEGNSGPPLISSNVAGYDAASLTALIQQSMPLNASGSLSDAQYRALAAMIVARNAAK